MRWTFIILVIQLAACSTGPQIQLPDTNQNYATKGYVDTATQRSIAPLLKDIAILKTQNAQYKKTADSLKSEIIKNTIKIDTSTGSDFNIKDGVMTFNKPNLTKAVKAIILQSVPVTKKVVKKNKN